MFGQPMDEVREEWDKLTTSVLAYVFLDAARGLTGQQPKVARALSLKVGMCVDVYYGDDAPSLEQSMSALERRVSQVPDFKEDPFVKPIFDALSAANLPAHADARAIALAAKDVALPPAKIKVQKAFICLF